MNSSPCSSQSADSEITITVDCSRKSHLVQVNEPFDFIINADKPQKLKVVVSMDCEAVLQNLTVTPPARITAFLPQPGFVRCVVSSLEQNAKTVCCGVGVAPDQLRPLLSEPSDFDDFWNDTKRELAQIPSDFKMRKVYSDETFNYYVVSCANLNNQRAYALLSLPIDTTHKMPLLVTFPGGEAYISEESIRGSVKAEMGFECARLLFQLPPYPPVEKESDAKGRHEEFLKDLGLKRYIYYGMNDRNIFYARTAVAGCLRLLDEVVKLPRVDSECVGYMGSSHGGGFGIYLAAFSDKIKAAFCGVPNFGDRGGFLAGRHTPDCNAQEYRSNLDTLQYFDASFAARRIEIPVMISAGFIDSACPPSAVYTIYNELRGPKFIFNKIKNGHGDAPPEYAPLLHLWLSKQMKS